MSTQLKLRRGTTAQHSTFTGAEGEVTVDTTKDTLVVHDGTTAGGVPLMKESGSTVGANFATASGNVGFGTSSPAYKLDAQTTATGTAAGDNTVGYFGSLASGRDANIRFGDSVNSSARIGYLSGAMYMYTNAAERVRIDTSGNVGIGTSSPTYKLDVLANGNASIAIGQSGDDPFLWFDRSDGGSNRLAWRLRESSGRALIFETGTNATKYGQTFTEAARIDSSGNLLVGTTAAPSSSVGGARIQGSQSTAFFQSSAQTTSGYNHSNFYNTNGLVGSIYTSGSATTYSTSSDYRLKEAIAPMTGALAKVAALKPCTYKWKVDGSDGQGFIAHELAEVEAGCVTGEKDAVDADGNPQYQGIDTSFLVATLAAAIQELKVIVDEQSSLITAQSTTITALTARIDILEQGGV